MTNNQAKKLIGQNITVRHKITGDKYNIRLVRRWTGTVFVIAENAFGIEQTTKEPIFNVYPVELDN